VHRRTDVAIRDDGFVINGDPTYAGRAWNGLKIEGLLFNARMVQATFDDLNPETAGKWAYPDTGKWDPERQNREFVAALEEYRSHGILAVTVNFQGGNPSGYSPNQPWHNSAFREDGSMRPEYLERMRRVLDRADEMRMVVILGIFYFGQDERLKDESAVIAGFDNALGWVVDGGWRNVIIEVDNECDIDGVIPSAEKTHFSYQHPILRAPRVHELIERGKRVSGKGGHLLVGTSFCGGSVPTANIVGASDFILIHGNGVTDPSRIAGIVRETRKVPGYRPMPILYNEDDHFDFDKPRNNMLAAVGEYASWGYYDPGKNDYVDGYQSPPTNWGLNTDRKRSFFAKVKEITGS
jgi:hypothetical protein